MRRRDGARRVGRRSGGGVCHRAYHAVPEAISALAGHRGSLRKAIPPASPPLRGLCVALRVSVPSSPQLKKRRAALAPGDAVPSMGVAGASGSSAGHCHSCLECVCLSPRRRMLPWPIFLLARRWLAFRVSRGLAAQGSERDESGAPLEYAFCGPASGLAWPSGACGARPGAADLPATHSETSLGAQGAQTPQGFRGLTRERGRRQSCHTVPARSCQRRCSAQVLPTAASMPALPRAIATRSAAELASHPPRQVSEQANDPLPAALTGPSAGATGAAAEDLEPVATVRGVAKAGPRCLSAASLSPLLPFRYREHLGLQTLGEAAAVVRVDSSSHSGAGTDGIPDCPPACAGRWRSGYLGSSESPSSTCKPLPPLGTSSRIATC